MLEARGYHFASQTDSEVIAHLIDGCDGDLQAAVQQASQRLHGALRSPCSPRRAAARRRRARRLAARSSSAGRTAPTTRPDAMALAGVTGPDRLPEEGDVADLQLGKHWSPTRGAEPGAGFKTVQREVRTVCAQRRRRAGAPTATTCRRIFEQPRAIADTLEGRRRHLARAVRRRRLPHLQGRGRLGADPACGTSSYAG